MLGCPHGRATLAERARADGMEGLPDRLNDLEPPGRSTAQNPGRRNPAPVRGTSTPVRSPQRRTTNGRTGRRRNDVKKPPDLPGRSTGEGPVDPAYLLPNR